MTLASSFYTISPILAILSATIIHHYATPGTPIAIRSLASLAFFLGFGGIALLPIDLSLTQSRSKISGDDGILDVNVTYFPWKVTYWSTFLLAWTALPLTRTFLLSGHFTPLSRMRDAGRKSLRGYIIMIVLSVAGIIALAIELHSLDVIPVLMTAGNTYGLLLVSLLLGYGLIDLPRRMWRKASPDLELRRARIMASSADDALSNAVWALQDCEDDIDATIKNIQSHSSLPPTLPTLCAISYSACVEQLLQRRNSTAILDRELQSRRTNHRHTNDDDQISDNLSGDNLPPINDLAKLNARLRIAQMKLISAEQRWADLGERSELYSELVRPVPPTGNIETSPVGHAFHGFAWVRYFWRTRIRSSYYRLLATITGSLSVLVLWSEATMSLPFNLSPFALFLAWFDRIGGEEDKGIMFKTMALIPLLYMSACVYGSLFKLALFGMYCLRGHNQSPGVALLFNAQYLIRMQFPLGYNYLLMIKYDVSSTNCAFSHVMSNMSTVPFFGTSFTVYAPLLILMLCGFTLCDGYPRLLGILGVEHEDVILLGDQETLETQVNEGIVLLKRRKNRVTDSEANDDENENGDVKMSEETEQGQSNKKWWHNVV